MSKHLIDMEGDKLLISFPLYDLGLNSKVQDLPNAVFDKQKRIWNVPKKYFAAVMSQFPGFAASDKVEALYQKYKNNETKYKNNLYNTDVLHYQPLYDHQLSGAKFILKHKRVLLCDEMGLGKTRTALVAGRASNLPIYVIAPKSLHVNWMREAYIVNVHIKKLISWAKILPPPLEDCFVIMDEAHALQSMQSARTKKALDFCAEAPYVVAITGTPIKNGRPSNLFGLLCAIKHPLSFKKRTYERVYCGARANSKSTETDRSGATNLTGLHERISASLLFRRKNDCLDLPDKIRTLRIAELTGEMEKVYNESFQAIRENWLKDSLNPRYNSLVHFGQLRQAASFAKIYEAVKIADELADNKHQAVFFVSYVDSANKLYEELNKIAPCGLITGDVSVDKRQATIDKFQRSELTFMVSTYGVGGLGINLTAAHHCILVDRAWTPGDVLQAEDRLHRIGQKDTVIITWIQCDNSTDPRVDNMLLRKQQNISSIMVGNKNTLSINIDEVLREVFK
jgi:SNF2 family DNA or RNA helicase